MFDLLAGAVAMGYFLGALFFLRFWRDTRDGLFIGFALAFALLALNQILAYGIPDENRAYIYLLRVLAFTIILIAIVRKNLARK